LERAGKLRGRRLRLLDALGVLGLAQLGELRAELVQLAAARTLLRRLAEPCDRDGVAEQPPIADRYAPLVEREPREGVRSVGEGAEVDPQPHGRLGGDDGCELLVGPCQLPGGARDPLQILAQTHEASLVAATRLSPRGGGLAPAC